MKTKIATSVLALAMLTGLLAGTATDAEAKKPADGGSACLKAGQETLRGLGAFSAAARGEVDYAAFANAEDGPIFLDLPEGSFLPINDVFALHKSNPELFAWCS